jgi:hypothetical protein
MFADHVAENHFLEANFAKTGSSVGFPIEDPKFKLTEPREIGTLLPGKKAQFLKLPEKRQKE